jgi:hypothetical protein
MAASGKSKVEKSSTPSFAKGGSTKMFGQQHAGTKTPGNTGHEVSGGDGKFAKGGSGHMFGKQSANQKVAGTTGKP